MIHSLIDFAFASDWGGGAATTVKMMAMKVQWAWSILLAIISKI